MSDETSWLSSGITGGLAAAIFVPLIVLVLRRLKGLQPQQTTERPLEELVKEYHWWNAGSGFIYLAISFVIAGALTWLTYNIDIFISQFTQKSLFEFKTEWVIYALPAFFLAMILAIVPSYALLRKMLGDQRYAEYLDYYNRVHGIDSMKVLKGLAFVFVPLTLVGFFLIFNTVTKVTETGIVFSGFTQLSTTTYTYNKVKKVELVKSFEAPNGNIVRDPHYIIYFADQQDWNLRDSLSDLDETQQKAIAEFVAGKAQLTISVSDPF